MIRELESELPEDLCLVVEVGIGQDAGDVDKLGDDGVGARVERGLALDQLAVALGDLRRDAVPVPVAGWRGGGPGLGQGVQRVAQAVGRELAGQPPVDPADNASSAIGGLDHPRAGCPRRACSVSPSVNRISPPHQACHTFDHLPRRSRFR